MARIDNAYAYYISTYAKKTVSRYDSHKKSELRKVYNEIVKINKDSPLYKIPNLTDAKKYAIDAPFRTLWHLFPTNMVHLRILLRRKLPCLPMTKKSV